MNCKCGKRLNKGNLSGKCSKCSKPDRAMAAAMTVTPRFRCGQKNAKARNLSWDLDRDSYSQIITKDCSYCNRTLRWETGCSLDRIDNTKGYTKDNVLPCCAFCNRLRSNVLTVEETKVVVEALMSYRSGNFTAYIRAELEKHRAY